MFAIFASIFKLLKLPINLQQNSSMQLFLEYLENIFSSHSYLWPRRKCVGGCFVDAVCISNRCSHVANDNAPCDDSLCLLQRFIFKLFFQFFFYSLCIVTAICVLLFYGHKCNSNYCRMKLWCEFLRCTFFVHFIWLRRFSKIYFKFFVS